MAEEYPSSAYILTLIGGILAIVIGMPVAFFGMLFSLPTFGLGGVCFVIPLIGGILGVLAATWMKDPGKVKTGGVLAIIAAFLGSVGVISFILMIIGGILALTWTPPPRVTPPPPPPPGQQ